MAKASTYISGNGNANANGDSIETFVKAKQSISLQIVSTSFNAADATIKAQESNDGTNWADVPSASVTLATGSAANPAISITPRCRFNRFVYTKNSVSAGTYVGTIYYI